MARSAPGHRSAAGFAQPTPRKSHDLHVWPRPATARSRRHHQPIPRLPHSPACGYRAHPHPTVTRCRRREPPSAQTSAPAQDPRPHPNPPTRTHRQTPWCPQRPDPALPTPRPLLREPLPGRPPGRSENPTKQNQPRSLLPALRASLMPRPVEKTSRKYVTLSFLAKGNLKGFKGSKRSPVFSPTIFTG